MKITEIDKNFAVKSTISREDVHYYDVCIEPFKVYGLSTPQSSDDKFRRMPEEVAKKVSEGVLYLHSNTAGGRVRFKTDSSYIAIHAEMPSDKIGKMSHFPLTGSAGFDLYGKYDGKYSYLKTFTPPYNIENGYESEYEVYQPEMREYELNFPLYSDVSKLYIILDKSAAVLSGEEYKIQKPVLYYGSSITQGGCASRPGNSYQSIISRVLDCNYINLGFSGNAKGEDEIAYYIASLDISAFVYDYDHNAPNIQHLKNTHKRMFDIIRKSQPEIPIVCVSRPVSTISENADERRKIILDTINSAKKSGDNMVFFVDGADFGKNSYVYDSTSVDGCHPNDLGFMCMAKCIGEALSKLL